MEKNHEITEDDLKSTEEDIQKMTDKYVKEIDVIVSEKEKEIMALGFIGYCYYSFIRKAKPVKILFIS